jgi:hypothetical protein
MSLHDSVFSAFLFSTKDIEESQMVDADQEELLSLWEGSYNTVYKDNVIKGLRKYHPSEWNTKALKEITRNNRIHLEQSLNFLWAQSMYRGIKSIKREGGNLEFASIPPALQRQMDRQGISASDIPPEMMDFLVARHYDKSLNAAAKREIYKTILTPLREEKDQRIKNQKKEGGSKATRERGEITAEKQVEKILDARNMATLMKDAAALSGATGIEETEIRERVRTLETGYPALAKKSIFNQYLEERNKTVAVNMSLEGERDVKRLTANYLKNKDFSKLREGFSRTFAKASPEEKADIDKLIASNMPEEEFVKELGRKFPDLDKLTRSKLEDQYRRYQSTSDTDRYLDRVAEIDAKSKRLMVSDIQRLQNGLKRPYSQQEIEDAETRLEGNYAGLTLNEQSAERRSKLKKKLDEIFGTKVNTRLINSTLKERTRKYAQDGLTQAQIEEKEAKLKILKTNYLKVQKQRLDLLNYSPEKLDEFLDRQPNSADLKSKFREAKNFKDELLANVNSEDDNPIARVEREVRALSRRRTRALQDRDLRVAKSVEKELAGVTKKLEKLRAQVAKDKKIAATTGAAVVTNPDEQVKLPADLRRKVATYLHNGSMEKTPIAATYAELDEIKRELKQKIEDGLSSQKAAKQIANTEISAAYNIGRLKVLLDEGIKLFEFKAILDERTTVFCNSLNGVVFSAEELHQISKNQTFPRTKEDQSSAYNTRVAVRSSLSQANVWVPPCHPNAYLPNTKVVTIAPELLMRKRYDGKIVTITTENANTLQVTCDHPILTQRGFIEAGSLDVTDYVFDTFIGPNLAINHPDYQRMVPTVEHLFELNAISTSEFLMPIPTKDLDGYVTDNEVNVEFSQGNFLQDGSPQLSLVQLTSKENLQVTDSEMGLGFEPSESFFTQLPSRGFRIGPTLCSAMTPLPTLFGSVPSVEVCDLRSPTTTDLLTHLSHGSFYNSLSNVQDLCHSFNRDSCSVGLQDYISEATAKNLFSFEPLNFFVRRAKITNLLFEEYSGLVYHVQDGTGINIANGIISHNCRSYLSPVLIKDEKEKKKLKLPEDAITEKEARMTKAKGALSDSRRLRRQTKNIIKAEDLTPSEVRDLASQQRGLVDLNKDPDSLFGISRKMDAAMRVIKRDNLLGKVSTLYGLYNKAKDFQRLYEVGLEAIRTSSVEDTRIQTEQDIARSLLLGGGILSAGALYYFFSKSNLASSLDEYIKNLNESFEDNVSDAAKTIMENFISSDPVWVSGPGELLQANRNRIDAADQAKDALAKKLADEKAAVDVLKQPLTPLNLVKKDVLAQQAKERSPEFVLMEKQIRLQTMQETIDNYDNADLGFVVNTIKSNQVSSEELYNALIGAFSNRINRVDSIVGQSLSRAMASTNRFAINMDDVATVEVWPNNLILKMKKGKGRPKFASRDLLKDPDYVGVDSYIKTEIDTLENYVDQLKELSVSGDDNGIKGAIAKKKVLELEVKVKKLRSIQRSINTKMDQGPAVNPPMPPKAKRGPVISEEAEIQIKDLLRQQMDEVDNIAKPLTQSKNYIDNIVLKQNGVSRGDSIQIELSQDPALIKAQIQKIQDIQEEIKELRDYDLSEFDRLVKTNKKYASNNLQLIKLKNPNPLESQAQVVKSLREGYLATIEQRLSHLDEDIQTLQKYIN